MIDAHYEARGLLARYAGLGQSPNSGRVPYFMQNLSSRAYIKGSEKLSQKLNAASRHHELSRNWTPFCRQGQHPRRRAKAVIMKQGRGTTTMPTRILRGHYGRCDGDDVSYARPQDADRGQIEFLLNCAGCHGTDAKGSGRQNAKLHIKPVDLTMLAKRNHEQLIPARSIR